MFSYEKLWLFSAFLVLFIHKSTGQCTANDQIGETDPSKKDKDNHDGTGFNAVLLTSNKYRFKCCGFISAWHVFLSKDATAPVDVLMQVWTDTGTLWNLRGENTVSLTAADATNDVTIAAGSRIRVYDNDQIGAYEASGFAVTYGGGSNGIEATFGGAQTTHDWDAETAFNNRDYGFYADVVPSAIPTISNLDDTAVIENTVVGGTTIFTLTLSDTDQEDIPNLRVSTTASTGSFSSLFELDTTTYEVKVRSSVKLTPGDHSNTYQVTDPCGRSTTGILTVRIENKAPVIDSLATSDSISISEDATDQLLHELLVTDTDTVTCQLDTTGVPFKIDKVTGSTNYGIYLELGGTVMDYDTQNAYVLELSCDDGYATSTGTYTVNLIRNEPPTIHGLPLAIDVTEDTIVETTLYTLIVTDPANQPVSCTVASTVPASVTIIFLKPGTNFNEYDIILQSNPNLQYDTQRTYRLNIDCTDGRRKDSGIFFMNVKRNQPPVFTNLQNITTLSSISSYIGQIVFDVDHTDSENDQVEYYMSCVPSTNCPFKIFDSGEILLQRQIEGEFVPAYDLYVYVTDGKSTTGPRSLTVHILDINYVPVIRNLPLPSALVIPENSNLGMSVFQVSIQDNDKADTHLYSMISAPEDGMLYFAIDSSTGLVKTSATTNINFEAMTTTSYVFTITVSDSKDSSAKQLLVTISNINEAPIFSKKSYVLSIDEGAAGTLLTDPGYLYSDEDTGDTHTFSMSCGSNVGAFSIAPSTGRISLATDLDVDATGLASSYTCTVTVSDGALTDSASLVINVNNINDNTPTFAKDFFTFTLDINTAVNTVFGTAVATDGDAGAFGTFTFGLDQTAIGSDTFGINANGDMYLKKSLTSFGYGQSLTFTVQATDTGGLQGTSTVFVLIAQTTTVTTTTTERYVTFWEYPANIAWVIIAIVLGAIISVLPCIMIWRNKGQCTYKGRPKPLSEDRKQISDDFKQKPQVRRFQPDWKPWKWFQIQHR